MQIPEKALCFTVSLYTVFKYICHTLYLKAGDKLSPLIRIPVLLVY